MNTIARNAIYAATVISLWPFVVYATPLADETSTSCAPLLPPAFARNHIEPEPVVQRTRQAPVSVPAGVEFQMHAGRLQPQLERILRQHMAIQHVVWQAAEEHEWPSAYVLEAQSWDALMESLLAPYQLRLQVFANHSAVISYLPQSVTTGRGAYEL